MPTRREDFEDQETCADLRGEHIILPEIMVRQCNLKTSLNMEALSKKKKEKHILIKHNRIIQTRC